MENVRYIVQLQIIPVIIFLTAIINVYLNAVTADGIFLFIYIHVYGKYSYI
jgi:hypothetical protein